MNFLRFFLIQLPHIVFCYASAKSSYAGGSEAGGPRFGAYRGDNLGPYRLPNCPQLEVLNEVKNRTESWSE